MCLRVRGVGWGRHPWRALGTSQHAGQSNKHAKHGPLDLIPCPCLEFWKSPQSGEGWAAWPCSQSRQNGGCTVWGPVGPEPREPCAAAQGWERRASHSLMSMLTFCAKPQSPRPPGTARGTEDRGRETRAQGLLLVLGPSPGPSSASPEVPSSCPFLGVMAQAGSRAITSRRELREGRRH